MSGIFGLLVLDCLSFLNLIRSSMKMCPGAEKPGMSGWDYLQIFLLCCFQVQGMGINHP
jgi:hypothetical protein